MFVPERAGVPGVFRGNERNSKKGKVVALRCGLSSLNCNLCLSLIIEALGL
jgi:hypothetical protein